MASLLTRSLAVQVTLFATLVVAAGGPALARGGPTFTQSTAPTVSPDAGQEALARDLWIDGDELERLIATDAVIVIDVRSPTAYSYSHLLNAVSIPVRELPRRLADLRLAGKAIVTYTDVGGTESARAAELLRRYGLTEARALSGGLAGWMAEGRVLEVPPTS